MAWRHRSAHCTLPSASPAPAARASAAPAALLLSPGTGFGGTPISGAIDSSLTADGVQSPLLRAPTLPDPLMLVLTGLADMGAGMGAGVGAGMRLLGTAGDTPDGR